MIDPNVEAVRRGELAGASLRAMVVITQRHLGLPETGVCDATTRHLLLEQTGYLAREVEAIDQYNTLSGKAMLVMASYIGWGETTGNNRGAFITRMREETLLGGTGAWCGLGTSFAFLRAHRMIYGQGPLPFALHRGARRLIRNIAEASGGQYLTEPMEGAVICWKRFGWRGHIGFVWRWAPETDVMWRLHGNFGPFPSTFRIDEMKPGEWRKKLYRMAII